MKKLLLILLLLPSLSFGAKVLTEGGITLDCPDATVDQLQQWINSHPNDRVLCCGTGDDKKCVLIDKIEQITSLSADNNVGDKPDTGPSIDPGIGIFAGLLLIALAIYFGRKRG
ncbi:LPXTG cell wall anchor domain-containing protein [Larkinella terrae]|uniref:LPXTG cell wall anchor domain-containing protein n=1 Tax=Larkinella terrae TaxID=2025311 RepID=A0A7K0EDC9_9BACT|nr:LPXTG cell wall anchor domain-containing protein [Larkinella terrae]MRS59873.1 LPXTG cell wall anchor domain-containing protein [Larkinella terrae]